MGQSLAFSRKAGNFPELIRLKPRRDWHSACSPSGRAAAKRQGGAAVKARLLRRKDAKMTRPTRKSSTTLARMLILGTPLLLLGACAAAAEYELAPGQKAVGELSRYVVKQGDVFPDIARHFDIGYT